MKRKKSILEVFFNQVIKLVFVLLAVFGGIILIMSVDVEAKVSVTRKMEFDRNVSFLENIGTKVGKAAGGIMKGYQTYKKYGG